MIIGINGRIGAGKDSLGMILQALTMERIGSRFKAHPLEYLKGYEGMPNWKGGWLIKKFATKLKIIAGLLLGVDPSRFEDQDYKNSVLSVEWDTWEVSFQYSNSTKGFVSEEEALAWETNERRAQQWHKDFRTEIKRHQMTVREFLQKLGTDAMRFGLHQNTWVNALMADYKEGDNWIVTDVRFPNEAQAIKERGGVVIRVERPDNPFPASNHESETALDGWHFDSIIRNESLEYLVERAKNILELYANTNMS